jgi:LacI family transcriptional regulator
MLPIDIIMLFCNNDYNNTGNNTGNDTGNDTGNNTGNNTPEYIMKRNPKAVTIRDVAIKAGVSVTTVSRVLNGKDDISEETTQKVLAVVQNLGYVSSLAARGMRSHKINLIGLILHDVASLYSQEILRGVNRVIANLDKDLIVYTSGGLDSENVAQHECYYVALLNGSITDGAIMVTPTATQFTTHAPLVIIDPNNETPDYPAVIATNREGALAAMNYLTGLGHRRIGHITGEMKLISAIQRLQGYKDGLAAAGIPLNEDLIEIGDYMTETAVICARKLLSLPDRPTAIFAANDNSAMGVYQAARELGLQIPGDLSVIGFDNLHEAAYLDPPLTTIDQFIEKMATTATEMLVKLVEGESLPTNPAEDRNLYMIPTQLVIRDSCRSWPLYSSDEPSGTYPQRATKR